jgi:hypothetical protein
MGGISKQGNRLLRFLLVEAANIAVRFDPELRKDSGCNEGRLRTTDLCSLYREIWDTSSLTRERNCFKMGEALALR